MLMGSDNPDILGRYYLALDEAMEATNRSCYRIKGHQKKLKFMPI
jgi:hypothetical protein